MYQSQSISKLEFIQGSHADHRKRLDHLELFETSLLKSLTSVSGWSNLDRAAKAVRETCWLVVFDTTLEGLTGIPDVNTLGKRQ